MQDTPKLTEREKQIAIDAMKFMYQQLEQSPILEPWQEFDVENHYINDFIKTL